MEDVGTNFLGDEFLGYTGKPVQNCLCVVKKLRISAMLRVSADFLQFHIALPCDAFN